MANSYNPEFTLTLQGCYITAMVFGSIMVLECLPMFIFHDLRAFQQLEFNYILKLKPFGVSTSKD